MAHYAIMRGEKRKTGDVRGITAHIARSQETPNADPEKRDQNYAVVGPAWDDQRAINDAIEARTPQKYRKDAVRAIEFVVSASPGWFDDNSDQLAERYFESAASWFREEYGVENVVSAVVHRDESTPHMHILVVPLDAETGRLNGKWAFGNKGVLQKRQTRFADHMASFGVERGTPDPERQHTKVAEWRAGHAKLDEREAHLIKGETEYNQAAIRYNEDLEALEKREMAVEKRAESLSKRDEKLTARLDEVESEKAQASLLKADMATREASLAKREASAATEAARLARLRSELEARGEQLEEGEQALQESQAEIDVRLKELREGEQALKIWQQQRDAWLAENRPPEVPELVTRLRKVAAMGRREAVEWLSREENDDLMDWYNPLDDSYTPQGRELLARYESAAEQRERWERTVEPPQPGL